MTHQTLVAFAAILGFSFASATRVLPRDDYADAPSKAFRELREIIIHPRNQYSLDLPPRLHFPAEPLMPHPPSFQDEAANVKRMLLGKRQSCSAGYGYCYGSGRCCPEANGYGKCCTDGTCIDSASQTCCLYGGHCNNDTKCCQDGCAPQGTECCGDGACPVGYFCCGDGVCAPEGGECCRGGGVCPSGKICVLYDGSPTCCTDLSCDEFSSGSSGGSTGGNDDSDVPVSVPLPTSSTRDTTVSSFDSSDYPSLPSVTLPPLPSVPSSFTFPTITAATASGVVLSTFSTTLTYYYYTIFVTTTFLFREESTFVTSDFTSTTTRVTALATDSLDAMLVFNTLRRSLNDASTPRVTASAARDFSRTYTPTSTSSTRVSQFTGAAGAGGAEGAMSAAGRSVRRWEWGVWIWAAVGVAAAVGMVLL